MQDGLWLGLFALLCVGIGGLLAACGRAVTELAASGDGVTSGVPQGVAAGTGAGPRATNGTGLHAGSASAGAAR